MKLTLVESDTLDPLMKKKKKKKITDKSQHKKSSETSKSTLFFHSKPMEESVILTIQYTGLSTVVKLKARILVGYFPLFAQKTYIMTFF